MVSINVVEGLVALAVCIPSAIAGLAVWWLEQKYTRRAKAAEEARGRRDREFAEAEQKRQENELFVIRCLLASLSLGEATARAVQRIPDAHCNGDMTDALDRAMGIQREYNEFLSRESVRNMYSSNDEGK